MERKAYPSDLTNAQWRLIAPLIPDAKPGGRPRKYEMREVINGLLYLVREGCSWRALPHDLPHWKTCYNFLRQFEADGTWDALVAALRVEVRTKLGREPTPSGACIDSQSAKTAHGGAEVGVDGGKMVRGRKRHIVTDTLGLLLIVVVTAANLDDGATAPRLLAGLPAVTFPRLAVVWADRKYRNSKLDAWLSGQHRLRVEVTSKAEGETGFKPLKKRWVVEQTFGCLLRWRRLVRDFERLPETSAAMVKLSSIHRMARRARPPRWRKKFRYKRPPKVAA
jgi:putative transposase